MRRKLFIGAGLAVLALAGVCGYGVGTKHVDERWERCAVGRGVRSVVTTDDGRVVVAVESMRSGGVLVSSDAGDSFAPWDLEAEVVWGLGWLPQRRTVCAGIRGGVTCEDEGLNLRRGGNFDVYWIDEAGGRPIAGGAAAVVRFSDGSWSDATAPRGVHHGVAVAGDTVLLTTYRRPLAVSRDGGATYEETDMPGASVLAARGERIYAGGGVFGGFLQRSDDAGKSWREVEMPGSQPEALLVPFDDPDIVLLGTHGDVRTGAAFLSRDGGESWEDLGCPGEEVHALAVDERYLYCGGKSAPMPKRGERGLWRMELAELGLSG